MDCVLDSCYHTGTTCRLYIISQIDREGQVVIARILHMVPYSAVAFFFTEGGRASL